MWDDVFKRWVDLLLWWVPRTEERRPEKANESTPGPSEQGAGRVPEGAVEQAPTAEEIVTDDLTVIKGIGPAVQEKLLSLGIATFKDLATADPDYLVDQLKASLAISKVGVRGWIEAARERTRARE